MSSLSPGSVLFDTSGVALAVELNAAIPANTSALITINDGYVTTAAPSYTTGTYGSLSLDTLGNLRTLASQGTSPWTVIGTVTANAGTGNFTVVQPTAASLNATVVGTTAAGSGAATGLITIQGNAGGTPVPVSGTVTLSGPSAVTQSGTWVVNSDGYATTAAPAYSNNTFDPLSLDLLGNLRVLASQNGTWTVQQGGAPWSQNITQFGGSAVVTGTGASGSGIPRVTVSNDSNILATQSGAWTVQNDGYVTTAAPVYTTGTQAFLSLTTAGALRVDGSAVNQPVVGVGAAGTPSGGVVSVQGVTGGTPMPVSGSLTIDKSSTGTLTNVATSASSVTLLAANANRISATFYNDTVSNTLYLGLTSSAVSTTSFTVKIIAGNYWELPVDYTGQVNGIWASAAVGACRVTELT